MMFDYETIQSWIEKNGTGEKERYYCNGLSWLLAVMKDGWISVFEIIDGHRYRAAIQAADMVHAKSYCGLTEPVTVPMQRLC